MTSKTMSSICQLVLALLLVTAIDGHPQLSRLLTSVIQSRNNQQQQQQLQQLYQQQSNQQLFGQQQLSGQQQMNQQQLSQQLLGRQQLNQQLMNQQQLNQQLGQQQWSGQDETSLEAALRCGRGGRGRGWGFNPFFGLGALFGLGGGGFGRFRNSDAQQIVSAPVSLRERIAQQIRQQLQQVNQALGQTGLQKEQMSDQFVAEIVDKVEQGTADEVQLYLKRLQDQLDKYNELANSTGGKTASSKQ